MVFGEDNSVGEWGYNNAVFGRANSISSRCENTFVTGLGNTAFCNSQRVSG